MSEVAVVKIKFTEHEVQKLIFCIKSVHNMLNAFEIEPEQKWKISLNSILKDMEKISNDIKDAKETRINDKKESPDPKKEYINKITG